MKTKSKNSRSKLTAICLELGLASASLHAQTPPDQIVPFAADVKSLQVILQPSGIPATLKFANSGNTVFYFPTIGIQDAQVRNSGGQFGPLADAQGHLQLPSGIQSTIVCLTLRDFLQDVELQNEILQNLATNGFVRQFAPSPILAPAAVQSGRLARLIFNNPSANNARRILGESLLTDADANPAPKASFFLNADALALLRTTPEARYLSVAVDQSYRAQFRTTDLQVTLQSAQDSLANVLRSLNSIPAGPPTYLLSPSLPLQMPGGFVGKDSSFSSRVRSATKLDVLVRQGSNVDPNLVDRMLSFALNQANLAIAVSAQERQSAVATILLDDGLSITLPLGRIHDVALDIRNDTTSKYSSAFINAATKNSHTAVHGAADVDVGYFFGGSSSVDVTSDWSRSDYVNSKLDQFNHQLEAMSANLSGDFPYVTGMSFSDAGAVRNVNFTDVEQNFTQFSVDYATLESTRSLTEYAQQLNMARQVEALLVPQFEMGGAGVVGYADAVQRPGEWAITRTNYIRFSKPFASPPQISAALNVANWGGTSGNDTLVAVSTDNVTTDGFTVLFQTHPATPIYWMAASWVAIGQGRLNAGVNRGLAALGNVPGDSALIPAEARQAVLTPQLQSLPQLTEGKFRASFNGIPGRSYNVEASTDLAHWSPVGTTTATDFLVNVDLADTTAFPQRFFRVSTP